MDFKPKENGFSNGCRSKNSVQTTCNLEEALVLTGDGIYKYLVTIVSGINLLAGVIISISIAYVLPATDCDLKLTSNEKGLLASISFTGMIFSSHLFGFLSDTYGRRYIMIRCNLICAILSLLASIAPSTVVLTIMWFANGFVIAGTITPSYVIVSEFCPLKSRTRCILICAAISSLVATYLPSIAWLIFPLEIDVPLIWNLHYNSWRLYLALTAIPLIFSAIILLFISESPKFLLAKGYKQETIRILRTMYAMNTGKKPDEYPVEDICLDDNDEFGNVNMKLGFVKTMYYQTCMLFRPPLLRYMTISCATNFGLIGAYNIITLWLPENISQMSTYKENNFFENTTFCNVLKHYVKTLEPVNDFYLMYENNNNLTRATVLYDVDTICTVSLDENVYYVNIIIGIVQFFTFGITSKVMDITGRKPIIVIFIFLSSVCSVLITFIPISYTNIFFGLIVVLVGAVLPIAISFVVDFFPTHVRTMATCICMIFGRIGASAGSQLFGLLQNDYCEISYYGLSGFMIAIGILCLTIPLRK